MLSICTFVDDSKRFPPVSYYEQGGQRPHYRYIEVFIEQNLKTVKIEINIFAEETSEAHAVVIERG